ncbi:PAAR domain-containing protein [Pseudoduganella lutea]|uniref:PAAR domain-containing protein n=1 Tax=Pseudoduganella lutea TaxID=321985 RepID=A0A4P6KWZ6_9BURK|nr:PAAR domain-containing protein [Pseudoduganella lutea]QBE62738.1 PAAR domain-containing protein [Pseudoduganella lutea]
MVIRYHITLGARTTAGGAVISASSARFINGVKVAVEDDKIACPACKSTGVIKPGGPRIPETCDGKQVALQDDLCICKCAPPPRLIANQTLKSQRIDGEGHAAGMALKAALVADDQSAIEQVSDDALPLLLVHPGTEEPFNYRAYRLELTDDRTIQGTTDEDGATRPLTADERKSLVAWHVAD